MPTVKSTRKKKPALATYYDLSQRPLQVLVFLLPLIVLYEWGVFQFLQGGDITARAMLKSFFQQIGIGQAGSYLPGIAVVVLLLTMHVVQGEQWKVQPRLFPMMGLESFILALPILLFAVVFLGRPARDASTTWQALLVYYVGAGIYEELVFRVIGIAVIHALAIDLLALPRHVGELSAIGITAVLFVLVHFITVQVNGLGKISIELEANVLRNMFTLHIRKTVFFFLAGVYLACIYVYRGFGIVAATHAIYDVLVFTAAEMSVQ